MTYAQKCRSSFYAALTLAGVAILFSEQGLWSVVFFATLLGLAVYGHFALNDLIDHNQRLQRRSHLLTTLIESLPDALFVVDETGQIVRCNYRAEEIFGYQQRELLTMNVDQLLPNALRGQHSKHRADYLSLPTIRPLGRGAPLVAQHRDGRQIAVEISLGTTYDERQNLRVLALIRDVSETSELRARLQRAAIVFEHANDAIIVCDADNKILSVNPAYQEITGYSEQEVVGTDPCFVKSSEDVDGASCELWQSLMDKGYWQGELWDRRKNGEVFAKWVSINVVKNQLNQVSNYVAVCTDVSKLKLNEQRLWRMAYHDALTGLPNRQLFNIELHGAIARARRHTHRLVVLYIDLDKFKPVNDSHGHSKGDLVLRHIATGLSKTVRDEDVVARLGGDEFTVLLENIQSRRDVLAIADKILQIIAEPMTLDCQAVSVSASIGVSVFPGDGDNPQQLLDSADRAMYQAKKCGENKIVFFDDKNLPDEIPGGE